MDSNRVNESVTVNYEEKGNAVGIETLKFSKKENESLTGLVIKGLRNFDGKLIIVIC